MLNFVVLSLYGYCFRGQLNVQLVIPCKEQKYEFFDIKQHAGRFFSHIHLPKLEIKFSLQQTSLHTATTSNYLTEDTTEEEDLCDELILSEILGVVKGDDEGPPWGQQRWN